MNDPIFSQMKEQLIPSPAARAALEEGLSRPVRRPVHRCRYWVLAACLLLAAALPLGVLSAAANALPLGSIGFGWVLPALAGLAGGLLLSRFSH